MAVKKGKKASIAKAIGKRKVAAKAKNTLQQDTAQIANATKAFKLAADKKGVSIAARDDKAKTEAVTLIESMTARVIVVALNASAKSIGRTEVRAPEAAAAAERFRHLAGVKQITLTRVGSEDPPVWLEVNDDTKLLDIPPALLRPLTPEEAARASAVVNAIKAQREAPPKMPAPRTNGTATQTAVAGTGGKPVKSQVEHSHPSHRNGSRKGAVHALYDTKGEDAARKYALDQGLKATTVTSWFSAWRRASGGAKAKAA